MQRVLGSVASRVDSSLHPLLTDREIGPDSRTLVIIVSGDKGLCGSFNTNVIKAAGALRHRRVRSRARWASSAARPATSSAAAGSRSPSKRSESSRQLRYRRCAADRARPRSDAFIAGDVDRVMLVYNEFRSVITQRVVVNQLLPIPRAAVDDATSAVSTAGAATVDYLYEPEPAKIFDQLLPRYIDVQVVRALLESNAAFYAAQMTAMDTATKNSSEMIGSLTLYMNKVRQAAITREIIEVVSGAQAL